MKYKTLPLAALIAFSLISISRETVAAEPEKKLFTESSTETSILSFDGKLHAVRKPSREEAKEQVLRQLRFLVGSLRSTAGPGVRNPLSGQAKVELGEIPPPHEGVWTIPYRASVVAQLPYGTSATWTACLPLDLAHVYERAKTDSGYPCTADPHYTSEQDFWFFFDPLLQGCRLKEDLDYFRVKIGLERAPLDLRTFEDRLDIQIQF